MFEEIGSFLGSVVGSVVGVSAAVIAMALELPVAAVNEALRAGCTTYDEVRDFCED